VDITKYFSVERPSPMVSSTKRGQCCGAVVLWCCGAVVLWCCGAVVLWLIAVENHSQ
jgi:hypothetical protein